MYWNSRKRRISRLCRRRRRRWWRRGGGRAGGSDVRKESICSTDLAPVRLQGEVEDDEVDKDEEEEDLR